MNKKKNLKKNQKDVKRGVQRATNIANKNSTIELGVESILLIPVASTDINSFQWVEEFGQRRQMIAFLSSAMIRDSMISNPSKRFLIKKKSGLISRIKTVSGYGMMIKSKNKILKTILDLIL
jgi:hypothetical protein